MSRCCNSPVASRSRASQPAAGFTLVEVVVALGILSLIMLATVSALRTFGNTQASVERLTARVDEIRTVGSFVRELLDSAVPGDADQESGGLSMGGEGAVQPPYFKGTEATLEWKVPIQFGENYGGTHLVQLARRKNSLALLWRLPPQRLHNVDWSEAQERVLVNGLQDFEVAYLSDHGADWQSEWSKKGSPALVRLTIKTRGRYWPDLIMRVQR